ncbi:MAG: M48 family metalloprotease [Cyclobacteriaceae bacterium]|nr:M48 family metalloprotease [Cyclobacteriaceae bacterium]
MKKIIIKGISTVLLLVIIVVSFMACDKNNNIVLFSIQNDIDLGLQVSQEIAADPTTYPILARSTNVEAYAYMDAMRDAILNSGQVVYKDDFAWEMHIINDPNTLNAFATPGGYIYVYTGLIKYLDKADDLAGVLGHEIAHADLRHTSRNLQKSYGVSFLLSLLLGENSSELAQIAGQLAGNVTGLAFSRDFEQEADAQSVMYLAQTGYACNGAAHFFELLEASGQMGSMPQFLSTHPSPDTRIVDIHTKATDEGCDTTPITESIGNTYADFKLLFQ